MATDPILHLKNRTNHPQHGHPLCRGIPFPAGVLTNGRPVTLVTDHGETIPCSTRPLTTWKDGSVQWLLFDFIVPTLDAASDVDYGLAIGKAPAAPPHPVIVEEAADAWTLTNGITRLKVHKAQGAPIDELSIHDRPIVAAGSQSDIVLADADWKLYRASRDPNRKVEIEVSNPVRATLKIIGTHVAGDGAKLLDYELRLTLWAGNSWIEMDHAFVNREQPAGGITIRGLQIELSTELGQDVTTIVRQTRHGEHPFPRLAEIRENVELVSTTCDEFDNYVERAGACGLTMIRNLSSLEKGDVYYSHYNSPWYRTGFRAAYRTGGYRKVYPHLGVTDGKTTLATVFLQAVHLHPKEISVDGNRLVWHIWPQWAKTLLIHQGQSRTHQIRLDALPGRAPNEWIDRAYLQWEGTGLDYTLMTSEPVALSYSHAYLAECKVLEQDRILPFMPARYPRLELLIRCVPSTIMSGIFDFGDTPGCSNNEDDCLVWWTICDYLRTGNPDLFDYAKATATHYFETDHIRYSQDRLRHGALMPHAQAHVEGPHYPSHQWLEGVIAWYCLTGNPRAKEAALMCGENILQWVEHAMHHVACDGRETGFPAMNLVLLHRLTHEQKYLAAARKVIEEGMIKKIDRYGGIKEPHPHESGFSRPTGYGEFASWAALLRYLEDDPDPKVREYALLEFDREIDPLKIAGTRDTRFYEFFAVWGAYQLTHDEKWIEKMRPAISALLKVGGYPTRRLHFLKLLHERGMIDDATAG